MSEVAGFLLDIVTIIAQENNRELYILIVSDQRFQTNSTKAGGRQQLSNNNKIKPMHEIMFARDHA